MRTSTVLVGLIVGAILAATLVPPLFVALPRRFVDSWYYVSPETALMALVGALVVVAFSGFVAGSLEPDEAVRTGTVAGLITAVVGGLLVALPAAEIEGCGALLSMSLQHSTAADALQAQTIETLIDGVWVPSMTGLALIAIGPALGAMGGVTYDLWRGTISRTTRTIRLSWVPIVGLWGVCAAVFVSTLWAVHLDITVLPRLESQPTWADRNALTSPLLVAAAAAALLAAWGSRDAVLVYRERRRISGLMWLAITQAPVITTLGVVAGFHPSSLVTLGPWVFGVVVLGASAVSAIDGARSELTFEPLPRAWSEVLGEGLLTGVVVTVSAVFIAVDTIVGTYVIAFPYVRAVLAGAAVVDAPPAELVTRVFLVHALFVLAIPTIAALYVGLASPLWLMGRLSRR